jgi:hypothetical protein
MLTAPEALYAHINGLERMIQCRGGLSSLSSSIQFLLAWYQTLLRKSRCSLNNSRYIVICQGQFKILFRREPDTTQSTLHIPLRILPAYFEISDFLSNLHWLACSCPSIFQVNAHFFGPQSPLYSTGSILISSHRRRR